VLVVLVIPAGVVVPCGGLMLRSVRHGRNGICQSYVFRLRFNANIFLNYTYSFDFSRSFANSAPNFIFIVVKT
jgi:hypothetical protein